MKGHQVTQEIANANKHEHFKNIFLFEGDLIHKNEDDNTWWIDAPGPAIGGFVLSPEEEATLREVEYEQDGNLNFWIVEKPE